MKERSYLVQWLQEMHSIFKQTTHLSLWAVCHSMYYLVYKLQFLLFDTIVINLSCIFFNVTVASHKCDNSWKQWFCSNTCLILTWCLPALVSVGDLNS